MVHILNGNQTFAKPQDALVHYGVKGMRWGVVNADDKSGKGSGRSRSVRAKPKEDSVDDLSKAIDKAFEGQSSAQIKAEGQAKLDNQAKHGDFPSSKQIKRGEKADKIRAQAGEFDKAAQLMREEAAKIGDPGKNVRKRYERKIYNDQADLNEKSRDAFLKKADQVQEGRLTDNQKMLIGIGAAAAATGLAVYGTQKYREHQIGLTSSKKSELLEANKRETERQWESLFGEKHSFEPAASAHTVSEGSFYAGLTNKKALSRPEFTIPEGTVFQRLSNHEEDSSEYGKIKGAYATFLSNDKRIYGASGEFGSKKYTIGFEAQGPTRVPSIQTVLAHMKQIKEHEYPGSPNNTPEALMTEYKSMAGGNWSDSTSQKLFASLRTYGYGAIVDDMDAGYLGDLPVVFFGAAKPATSTPRTSADTLTDKSALLKLSRRHA